MLALPGAEGMFSYIQAALVTTGLSNRIKVDRSTRDELHDWTWLAGDITNRPTSIAKVVRHPLSSGKQPTLLKLEWGVWFSI